VVERRLDSSLLLQGELNPYESVAIYPKVTGFLKSIRVDRGTRVRKGELIAQLDAPELTSQRSEAQSKLHSAEAALAAVRAKAESDASTYEKLKAASATPGVVAGNDVVVAQKAAQAGESQVAAAQQTVAAAQQAVKTVTEMEQYLRITAPFDGVVTERNAHPGALVGPAGASSGSSPLLRVIANRRLRLVVAVPEAYLAGISTGATISFSVQAYPGQSFQGTVARIAGAVDPKTRTMAVELDVPNADERLAPGAFCQVRWPFHRPGPSLLVPAGSIASTTDRVFVIRVRNGRTEWIDVKTGLSAGASVEVFGDLRAGDEIAARGTDELRAGTEVDVKQSAPPPASRS
jgi:membrane fusion protein, multidrug efflux system